MYVNNKNVTIIAARAIADHGARSHVNEEINNRVTETIRELDLSAPVTILHTHSVEHHYSITGHCKLGHQC